MNIGMLFPDYGSQFVGMAKELYDESRVMQEYFEEASNCLNINFVKLCFASSDAELSKIYNAYVSLFLTSSAIAAVLKEEGIVPSQVAGHGIGEFSAVCTVGGISLPDGLYFLHKYAQFYQEALPSLSLQLLQVSGLSLIAVNKLCRAITRHEHELMIVVYESEKEFVIAGIPDALQALQAAVRQAKGTSAMTRSEGGLHCWAMDDVVTPLKLYLAKIDFKDVTIPLIACVDGKPVVKAELIKNRVVKQLHAPLMWHKVVSSFEQCDLIIEVGPGTTLSKIQERYPEKLYRAIGKKSDIIQLKELLAQQDMKMME